MLAFSALADPTRLRIVEMLASSGQLSATHISRRFSITPPAISQHLKILREARLVSVEVKAQQRIYSLDPGGMTEMEQWLHKTRQEWEQRFDALEALLREEMQKTAKPRKKRKPSHGKPKSK